MAFVLGVKLIIYFLIRDMQNSQKMLKWCNFWQKTDYLDEK